MRFAFSLALAALLVTCASPFTSGGPRAEPVRTAQSAPTLVTASRVEPNSAPTPVAELTPVASASATATPVPTSVPTATTGPSATATVRAATETPPTSVETALPTATARASATPTRTATPMPTLAPASASANIQDFAFAPGNVTIRVGGTVTWTNIGAAPHTATRTAGPSNFDTGIRQPGQSATITFSVAGAYSYQCTVHPSMTGTALVL